MGFRRHVSKDSKSGWHPILLRYPVAPILRGKTNYSRRSDHSERRGTFASSQSGLNLIRLALKHFQVQCFLSFVVVKGHEGNLHELFSRSFEMNSPCNVAVP